METKKATIKRNNDRSDLVLNIGNVDIGINLTDDNPNNIKSAFNILLRELKKGLLSFQLDDKTEDLYHHICDEYLTQLNSELKAVYSELSDMDLLES